MPVYPKHKTKELLGLLLLMLSLLLVLALYSYSPLDSSPNVAADKSFHINYIGPTGAWVADLLLQIFGIPAFLFPLALLISGIQRLRGISSDYPIIQTLGVVGTTLALCSGGFLLSHMLPFHLDYAIGGVLGILLGSLLTTAFNWTGALVLVSFGLMFALVFTTSFSFEAFLTWLGRQNWNPFPKIRNNYSAWQKKREDRKALKLFNSQDVVAQSPPRRILVDKHLGEDKDEPSTSEASPFPLVSPIQEGTDAAVTGSLNVRTKNPSQHDLPHLDFLTKSSGEITVNEQHLMGLAQKLTEKYAEFDVMGRVLQIHPGPIVTTFEFKPDAGVKYSRITTLTEDLCMALKAEAIRIHRIPGKNTVGIEVPNSHRQTIFLREILASPNFQKSDSILTLGLGKLINGNTCVTDLARMPHLLIAGATGSGKSVAVNCIVCSILYQASPQDVKFIMIDPKRLELGPYHDIPHLLTPIVTNPKEAANALGWAVREMERRYKLLAQKSVRNLDQYNKAAATPSRHQDDELHEPLPLIVIIVDELADLMMTAGKEVEASLTRLAQMARAIGIHLILATQRPSVDVITGLIKANFPSRISFRVSSKTDSRTVMDMNGAEQLLGQGDMLFLSPQTARPIRIHGGLVTEAEIESIATFLREQGHPAYQEKILEGEDEKEGRVVEVEDMHDPLYEEAAHFVVESGRASTSLLQRRLRVGYGRAARILDMMEYEGLITPPDGSKARKVLVSPDYFEEIETTQDS
jgi:S-DNA-T family DNA segregation ATPase FtsK/SpoIIIE